MELTTKEIAKMFDLSCVQINYTEVDLVELVNIARKYKCGQISVLQSMLKKSRELLANDKNIKLIGNVSFPSGSDTTELKVIQAKQMVENGCDEIDMVINVHWLKSGRLDLVKEDIKAVVDAVNEKLLKVIIEASCLNEEQIKNACEICIEAGATFVKTGTGWAGPTTINHVKLIKSIVGDSIAIKASGGVKNLDMLKEMYRAGASRFGVNLEGGKRILEECIRLGGTVTIN